MYLERIAGPADVKALPETELPALCKEIRRAIVDSSAVVGGHVASNLAVVELTVALHRVFDSPTDKIVFDVSHQCYAHKMLTGRAHAFLDPMRYEDVSGFTNPRESVHDHFAVGHTSTAASLVCGLAKARDLRGENHSVVAVIGDGSLSGGAEFEGLDWAGEQGGQMLFVINDNEWSIAPDAGGLYRMLAELRATKGASENNLFRSLGLDYRYLEDGHDLRALEQTLAELRGSDRPCVLHVHTVKGRGYAPAEADPESWHHVGPFDAKTGKLESRHKARSLDEEERDYAQLTGGFLLRRMAADPDVVAISAATPYIMGFGPERREAASKQFVDVGIAEGHAVTYAAALAQAGARPVVGVYGTFLQRGFDQLIHDAALNAAQVTFLVFGCSAHGTTDATHLGFFDIPMLGCVPGLTYLAPTCAEEYLTMLDWSLNRPAGASLGPVAIRVPAAGYVNRPSFAPLSDYSAPAMDLSRVREGAEVAVLALGDFYCLGEEACQELEARGVRASVVNPRCANAVDTHGLEALANRGARLFVVLEDGCVDGGFGSRVCAALAERGEARVIVLGLPKTFADRYDVDELLESRGLTPRAIADRVQDELG